MPDLAGKVVIVTGASRGIGAAAATALGKAGATLVLTARDRAQIEGVAQAITRDGGTAFADACDVSDWSAVQRLVAETQRRYGKIDALINNAGVIDPVAITADSDPAAWARSIEINLIGAYYAIRAVLPPMLAAGGGRIVNVSSGAAFNPQAGWSAYCSAKAGLAMLTRQIELEHAAQGIRVFGFQPGPTDTDMHVINRAVAINPISKIPRENLTPVAHPAAAIVYICAGAADDLAGKEFSLRDDAFRSRLNLT
jgi:NAD(P)-dependent dehydrogenase (short-subunit alcohol dehydrogenase family)